MAQGLGHRLQAQGLEFTESRWRGLGLWFRVQGLGFGT